MDMRAARTVLIGGVIAAGWTVHATRLSRRLHTDALTGVLTRSAFMRSATRLITRNGLHVCLGVVDLDRFKEVNDTLGHAAGDAALRATADWLRTLLPSNARIGRIGGDEFAVAIPLPCRDHGRIVQQLLSAAATGITGPNVPEDLSASLGIVSVAALDPAHRDVDTGLAAADEAMYRSKRRRMGKTRRETRRSDDRSARVDYKSRTTRPIPYGLGEMA